eukprot:s2027_g1.t1
MFGHFFYVHRVVAFTFLGPPDSASAWQVHHRDGDPMNNRLDNLTYVSQSENVQHSYDSNPFRGSSRTALSTPVVWRKLATLQNWTESPSITSAAKSLGLSPYLVTKHCRSGIPFKGYQLKFGASSEPLRLPGEEWLPMKNPLTGHVVEGRQVSSFGRLRSSTGLVTRGCKTHSGYFTAALREDYQRYQTLVHRLVAYAFLGPPPTSQHTQVNHKDLNRSNNCVENLEYVTPSENVRHFHATLGYQNGKESGAVPVLARPYGSGDSWIGFPSMLEAAKVLGINRHSISKCTKGLAKRAGTHEFRLAETDQPNRLQGEKWRVGRLLVSEVPKACFSSKNFESSGAQPQVAGVFEGDEIVSVNGEPAASVEKKILAEGDPWNACSSSKPRHPVGSKGKGSRHVSFLVPFVGIREQLREGLPWISIGILTLLAGVSLVLLFTGWTVACLNDGGSTGKMLLVANLLCAFILLVPQGLPAEMMLLFIGAICCFFGILQPKELFAGCASDAVVTLALLFPIMRAMGDTGVPERFIGCVLGTAQGPRSLIFRMFFAVALLSGFFNNTPIVVMMVPLLQSLCLRQGVPCQAVLMPLSFAAQAGGSLTKMGSSINFVADAVFQPYGYKIGFFTLTSGCFFICLLGAAYCSLLGPKILESAQPGANSETSARNGGGENHFKVAFKASEHGPLIGATLEDLGLHRIPGVNEIALHRDWLRRGIELRSAFSASREEAEEHQLSAEDLIQVTCSAEGVAQLRHVRGLELCNDFELSLLGSMRRKRCLCEAAVKETLVGSTIDARRWKSELRCAVVASRGDAAETESAPGAAPGTGTVGARATQSFNGYVIQSGDVLLLETFKEMVGSDIWVENFGVVRLVPNSAPPRRGKPADSLRAVFIVVGLLAMIIIASCGDKAPSLPLMAVIFLCGIIMVKGLKLEEVYQEINGQVLLTIVGALALGRALEVSCLANCMAQCIIAVTKPIGTVAVKAGIYAATIGLGQFLNSAANVAIMGKRLGSR